MDPWTAVVLFAVAASFLLLAMARGARTPPGHALDNPLRRLLSRFVRRHPGARLHEIRKGSGAPRGTVRHHLLLLETLGVIRVCKMGRTARYYPADVPAQETDALALLRQGRVPALVELVVAHPGWFQAQLAGPLGMRRKTFRSYADRLVKEGLVEERRDAFRQRYYPTERLERLLLAMDDDSDDDSGPGPRPPGTRGPGLRP